METPEPTLVRLHRQVIPPLAPLLVGRLILVEPTGGPRPRLELSVWCPYCRIAHSHPWFDPPSTVFDVAKVEAPCGPSSPFARSGYWIGLETPRSLDGNAAVLRFARNALAAWHARQLAAPSPAPGSEGTHA